MRAANKPSPTYSPSKMNRSHPSLNDEEFKVLVINSSQEMAKEITLQLTLNMPGCSIMYAPTIELARWILSRRKIDLVVSSPILPDGSIIKLKNALEQQLSPPNVVIVGDLSPSTTQAFQHSGYEIASVNRIGSPEKVSKPLPQRGLIPEVQRTTKQLGPSTTSVQPEIIRALGADLRNDLNNPLQEIVAMVFVAKAGNGSSTATSEALDAINSAAKNMAKVVKGLEDKILKAVQPNSLR